MIEPIFLVVLFVANGILFLVLVSWRRTLMKWHNCLNEATGDHVAEEYEKIMSLATTIVAREAIRKSMLEGEITPEEALELNQGLQTSREED